MPLFSVLIPTFNRKSFLKKAIDSVLNQSFSDFELIVLDDGSTDGTNDLMKSYSDGRISYQLQQNYGVAHARNCMLDAAQGAWIAFLDSDDWWAEEKLGRFFEVMNNNPGIKIFHSEEKWFKAGKLLNPQNKHKKPDGKVYSQALPLCCISISTAVIHECVFKEVGGFDETFEACEDYDFWLRATQRYPVKLIDEYLTLKDGGRPDQLSFSVWGLDRFRIKALEKMLVSGNLSREEYDETASTLIKKCLIFAKGAKKRGRNEDVQYYESLANKYAISENE